MTLAQVDLGPLETEFIRLIDADFGPALAVGALAIAFGIGALHALAPGHGKAIVAAYFAGMRGRALDAVALGGIVSAMHTGSVLVLGLGLHFALRGPLTPDRVTPWMLLASGGLVLTLGVLLVARQVRLRHVRRRDHDVAGHHHHHLPPGVSPLSRRGIILLGAAGGLLPSPSAFLVLATAIFTGRLAFGLALVVAFSVGLATTVTAVGLAALRGRLLLERRAAASPRVRRLTGALPLVSSVAILLGGLYLTTVAVWRL
jgi:nickel/cobalt transporter (NicO) family protein